MVRYPIGRPSMKGGSTTQDARLPRCLISCLTAHCLADDVRSSEGAAEFTADWCRDAPMWVVIQDRETQSETEVAHFLDAAVG